MKQERIFLKGRFSEYVTFLLLIFSLALSAPILLRSQNDPCKHPLPRGFKTIKQISQNAHPVFEMTSNNWQAVNGLNNLHGDPKIGPMAIRLDDGSQGTLTAQQKACKPGEACSPFDCGCFEVDSYWIHVKDAGGRKVANLQFWAPYGLFQILPVDLVDGPGQELLIFTLFQRGSGVRDEVMQIWKLGKKPVPLADLIHVSGTYSYCVPWRDKVYVSTSMKPCKLIIRRDVAADPCCVDKVGYDPKPWPAKIPWTKTLSFSGVTSKYRD